MQVRTCTCTHTHMHAHTCAHTVRKHVTCHAQSGRGAHGHAFEVFTKTKHFADSLGESLHGGAPALPQPSASCDVGRAPRPPVGTGAKLLSRPPSELLSRPPRGAGGWELTENNAGRGICAPRGPAPPNPARTEGSEPPGKVPLTHPSSTPRPLPEDGPSRTGTRTVARHVPPCKGAGGSAAVGSTSIKRQHWAQLKHFCCVEHRVTHANQRWGGGSSTPRKGIKDSFCINSS